MITIYCSSVFALFPASDVVSVSVSVYHRIASRLVVCCFLCYNLLALRVFSAFGLVVRQVLAFVGV